MPGTMLAREVGVHVGMLPHHLRSLAADMEERTLPLQAAQLGGMGLETH